MSTRLALGAVLLCGALPLAAASAAPLPQPLPMPPPLPAPRDLPFPGTIALRVDATDLVRHVMSVHETIPVPASLAGGGAGAADFVLLLPKWIPGAHGPVGPIELLTGLVVHAGGRTLAWKRDAVASNAFHVPVPAGATAIDLDFQFTSPARSDEGRVVMTPEMVNLEWTDTVLYPAGWFARDIPVAATAVLPQGWGIGTALAPRGTSGGETRFGTVKLDVLCDSPLIAGRFFRRYDLAPGARVPVHLDVVADRGSEAAASDTQVALHRALVAQATKLFGAQHYDHYDFLLALSDELGGEGLEHHRSSENAVDGGYFLHWDKTFAERDLLPHEYTHSWNGKYRRPADLWTPDYQTPERDSLLWVYEGQTEYWGQVLATRAGLWTRAQALDSLALIAAYLQAEAGRAWRPLADTTQSPIFVRRRPLPWLTWMRQEDYYEEGQLIWLDADTLIREKSGNRKSLDDVARGFFGMDDGDFGESTYRFDDVVRALNAVLPFDWAGFLQARLDRVDAPVPLDGITRGGYRLAFDDTPSPFETSMDAARKVDDFMFSLGITLEKSTISEVAWGGPAWHAGLLQGDELVAVDGIAYDGADGLNDMLREAKDTRTPMTFVVKTGIHVHAVSVDYHGGPRHPHLVRRDTGPASLDAILAARN